jgi:hypothetical protein
MDRVRHQAVRLAMDADCGLRVGCIDKTEDPSGSLVDPISQVADAIPILSPQISEVRLLDIEQLDLAVDCVNVHEERHRILLGIGGSGAGGVATSGDRPIFTVEVPRIEFAPGRPFPEIARSRG